MTAHRRGGTRDVTSEETSGWKRWQSRAMSSADQLDLKLADAMPSLRIAMVRSNSGISRSRDAGDTGFTGA